MSDQHSRQRFPKEDSSSSSAKSQARYKPLAPKGPAGGELAILNLAILAKDMWVSDADKIPNSHAGTAVHGLQRSRFGTGEAAQPLQDLAFVNMTDPQQSKSLESRKFVRRQVMVNFAREKRRQQKPSPPGGAQAGGGRLSTILGVRELFNAAIPTTDGTTDGSSERGGSGVDSASHCVQVAGASATCPSPQRRKSGRLLIPSTGCGASSVPRAEPSHWPVESDAQTQVLINHCEARPRRYTAPVVVHSNKPLCLGHSPLFRASRPQYMISLLANRLSAENYPFFIDIDCVEDGAHGHGAQNGQQSEFYRLAEASSMLSHALLMVSASHLAIIEPENAALRTRQAIDHTSKAIQLLNGAIESLPADKYVEILATVALLASHEVGSITPYPRLRRLNADDPFPADGRPLQ